MKNITSIAIERASTQSRIELELPFPMTFKRVSRWVRKKFPGWIITEWMDVFYDC